MKKLALLLLLIPSLSFAQCDTIKRLAATWVIQRNECRELLSITEQQVLNLKTSDSLNRLAIDKYLHSIDVLGKALVKSEQDSQLVKAELDKFKKKSRRRLILLPVGIISGFVVAVVL